MIEQLLLFDDIDEGITVADLIFDLLSIWRRGYSYYRFRPKPYPPFSISTSPTRPLHPLL